MHLTLRPMWYFNKLFIFCDVVLIRVSHTHILLVSLIPVAVWDLREVYIFEIFHIYRNRLEPCLTLKQEGKEQRDLQPIPEVNDKIISLVSLCAVLQNTIMMIPSTLYLINTHRLICSTGLYKDHIFLK